jgi:hypothetical protein
MYKNGQPLFMKMNWDLDFTSKKVFGKLSSNIGVGDTISDLFLKFFSGVCILLNITL